tara:strand:+ start:4378 stop:4725 length:348 start_codon:yes stop_codon:yes gene_type:complete
MKKSIFYLLLFIPLPLMAHDYHSSYEQNQKCYGKVYREKYIQGNINKPGYVRKWEETIRIPCEQHTIGIKNNSFERNDYQKIIKDNLKSFGKWVNSKIADWKLNQSDNYLNKKQD